MKVFVDANIFMYSVGGSHPSKEPSIRLLRSIAEGRIDAVCDTQLLQELLYRFCHLQRHAEGVALVEHVTRIVPTILPVETRDILVACQLLTQHTIIEPRDAVHAAVMLNHGMTQLYSYDRHFDRIPHLTRLEP